MDETMNEVALRTKEEGNKKSGKSYKIYSPDQKVLFLYYLQVKWYKAAKAARLSRVAERTGQQWAKRLRMSLNGIFLRSKRIRANKRLECCNKSTKSILLIYTIKTPKHVL
jgi:hypothetical protein